MTHCPNCQTPISTKMFKENSLVRPATLEFIHLFTSYKEENFCQKCVRDYLDQAVDEYQALEKEVESVYQTYINALPIVNVEQPINWDYQTIQIVSVIKKCKSTKDLAIDLVKEKCFHELRKNAILLGGNAILGAQISYDIIPQMYHILVSITGTVVHLKNSKQLTPHFYQAKEKFKAFDTTKKLLDKFVIRETGVDEKVFYRDRVE